MTEDFPESRAESIFLDALELPATDRDAFLAEACQQESTLLQEVQGLLAAHDKAEDFFHTPESSAPREEQAGEVVGGFTLEAVLGEGGFAVVWAARQEQPVKRRVAVKILKAGMDSREIVRRFQAERQALALMDHAGIPRIFDGGTTQRGRPWFAMELVDGLPVTRYCLDHGLPLRARLELFAEICRAAHHAHQKGVIHRDIKPNNVLVTEIDGKPTAKVIDFGIAKAIEQSLTEATASTRGGQLIGTPAYMSPEQVEGSLDIDIRTDVYALGALLCELLCGHPPFADMTQAGLGSVLQRIREETPRAPSRRDTLVETAGAIAPRHLRGDLDWIVLRCLEKDPARRYDSVAVLANEIERHLRGEAILAGPPSWSYRFGKFAKRHAMALLLSAAAMIGLLIGGALFVEQAHENTVELARFSEINAFLERLLLNVDPAIAEGLDKELMQRTLEAAEADLHAQSSLLPEVEGSLRRILGLAFLHLGDYPKAEQHLRQAMQLLEESRGPLHEESLLAADEFATLLLTLESNEEALALLQELRTRRETIAPKSQAMTYTLGNLGIALHRCGHSEEGIALLREVLARKQARFGEHDPETIRGKNNLAHALAGSGQQEAALSLYEEALRGQIMAQGESHPDTLKAMNNLGAQLLEAGRGEDALPWLKQSLQVKRKILGEGHPGLIPTLNNLAGVLRSLHRPEEADPLLAEAVELNTIALGKKHPNTLMQEFQRSLGLDSGEFAQPCIERLEQLLPDFREVFGEEHSMTIAVEGQMAKVYLELKRAEEAYEVAHHASVTAPKVMPEGHPAIKVFALREGLALMALGQPSKAKDIIEPLFPIGATYAPQAKRAPRQAAIAMVEIYQSLGQEEPARRWQQHADSLPAEED